MDGNSNLDDWLGRTQTVTDQLTRQTALRLAAMLDLPADGLVDGAETPQGWYAVLFGPTARQAMIGRDGHPRTGDFLPSLPLPRRMFAGRRVSFHRPLHIGDMAERVSEITKIEPKQGRRGAMIFVTVTHRIHAHGALAVTEEQDIVYREEAKPGAPPAAPQPPPANAVWTRSITPDPVLVFRYSAITFNGHRIHYDADYAREVEGYPERLVNGGLTTLLLLELARAQLERPIVSLATRNLRALFVNRPIALCGAPAADGGSAELWAVDADGALAVSAQLEIAP